MPYSDLEILARMLASEVGERDPGRDDARLVIGWITLARARGRSLNRFVLAGGEFGPQVAGRYASTARAGTASSIQMARDLLEHKVQPAAAIRGHKPGSWVERDQGLSDKRIVALQERFGEGIYGRLLGTRWVLYSQDTARIVSLEAVPLVSAR